MSDGISCPNSYRNQSIPISAENHYLKALPPEIGLTVDSSSSYALRTFLPFNIWSTHPAGQLITCKDAEAGRTIDDLYTWDTPRQTFGIQLKIGASLSNVQALPQPTGGVLGGAHLEFPVQLEATFPGVAQSARGRIQFINAAYLYVVPAIPLLSEQPWMLGMGVSVLSLGNLVLGGAAQINPLRPDKDATLIATASLRLRNNIWHPHKRN